jgi:hypothetical protein
MDQALQPSYLAQRGWGLFGVPFPTTGERK